MAERFGFFNAVIDGGEPDRTYTADDINNFFKGILSDGIFRGVEDALIVQSGGSGLSVTVGTGKALVNQHWYINDTVKTMTFTAAHATLNRYSGVAIRYTRATRTIELVTSDGTPATTPTYPVLTQNDDIYEMGLAIVYIGAGATTVTSSNITDVRDYVSGLVDPTPLAYRRLNLTQTGYPNGQRYFDIPTSYNFSLNTVLEVYDNGLLCDPSEYTIQVNEVEGNYMVVFTTVRAYGTVLSFVMIN